MFFSLPNLSALDVRLMEHPETYKYEGEFPDKTKTKKKEFVKWSSSLATEHSYISMFEGLSPVVRVDQETNPAHKVHGIIVDYDTPMQAEFMQFLQDHPMSIYRPMWLNSSWSGHCRLIWLFEMPMTVLSEEHWECILRKLYREIQFNKWHAGLDTGALASTSRYFEHGTNWTSIPSGKPIPASILQQWFFDAAKDCSVLSAVGEYANYEIPMEDLAREVEKQFPGRWKGEFAYGKYGVRFWDPAADNPTGAWVRKDGMICFTGDVKFMSWSKIFGTEFTAKYAEEAIGDLIDSSAYDGTSFYKKTKKGVWQKDSKEDYGQMLRIRLRGASRKKVKDESARIDEIEYMIKTERRIEAAFPFMYFNEGIITWRHKQYLNISSTRCTPPAPPCTSDLMTFEDGEIHFPFIHNFMSTMFVRPGDKDQHQLMAFLAWLKYFYVNSLNRTPKRGHAIVLAGPPGKGKSLMTKEIIGKLMGGYDDATNHLVGGSQWTAALAHSPLMAIEDSVGCADDKTLNAFSARLKKYVANPEILCNEKYEKAGTVPWFGRPIITCNTDSESLRILPNMDISIQDKVSLFKTSDHLVNFPDSAELERRLDNELPNFARFLVDWVIPVELISAEKRFGVRAFHHPELLQEARQQGVGTLVEVLLAYMDSYSTQYPAKSYWEGQSVDLHHELSALRPGIMKDISCASLGKQLGKLAKQGYGVSYTPARANSKLWRVTFDLNKETDPVKGATL